MLNSHRSRHLMNNLDNIKVITLRHYYLNSIDSHSHFHIRPAMNSSASIIPPGLTCDQYYLYLASGYAYSFTHGVMYRLSQVRSEHWISTVLNPYRLEETAYWLSLRHYYDFGQHCWIQATFDKSEEIQERIWQESRSSQTTFFRLQQKAGDVMNMMASMSLKSTHNGP